MPDLPWPSYQLAVGLYALTGFPAAVGIWRRSRWGPTAFWIWSMAALVAGTLQTLGMPTPFANRSLFVILVLLAGAVILVWLGRYVQRSIEPAASQAPEGGERGG